jgi:hypothetical protein
VYEPVLPDLRRPSHFTRSHGPAGDPDHYLDAIVRDVRPQHARVLPMAIADPISAAVGLEAHLRARPARLVILGGRDKNMHPDLGTVRELLRGATVPLLVTNRDAQEGANT